MIIFRIRCNDVVGTIDTAYLAAVFRDFAQGDFDYAILCKKIAAGMLPDRSDVGENTGYFDIDSMEKLELPACGQHYDIMSDNPHLGPIRIVRSRRKAA